CWILLFQTPPGDVANALRPMFVPAVVDLVAAEVADTVVENAGHQRLLGQLHHAVVEHDGGASGTHRAGTDRRRGRRGTSQARHPPCVGNRGDRFDVFRIRSDAFDVTP